VSRLGIGLTLLFVILLIGFTSMVRVTGPDWPGRVGSKPMPEPVVSSGPLMLPVKDVPAAKLIDSWADARGGGTRVHHAIDIMAARGTAVLAAADGRIEKLFDSHLGGHTIYQRSADGGTVFYYAHLDRYAPTLIEGQVVSAGQPIAAVGSTGDADPGAPHLHFEVHRMAAGDHWWQGAAVNPYPLLAGKAASR
jgi:peptidoglycan LD-endopeptidase LytH